MRPYDCGHRIVPVLLFGGVQPDEYDLTTRFLDRGPQLAAILFNDIGDDYLGAFCREHARGGGTDAPRCATNNKGYLCLKSNCVSRKKTYLRSYDGRFSSKPNTTFFVMLATR